MASFKFRAEPALAIRRKRDDEAQRALGDARRLQEAAERALADALSAFTAAQVRAAGEERQAVNAHLLVWHRNWMAGHRRAIATCRKNLAGAIEGVRVAADAAVAARRDLRALERLREKLFNRFQYAERRADQRQLDLHANLRFAARLACREERT
jgi:flagellar export protein FliJ